MASNTTVFALLAGHEVSEVANLVVVSRTTICAIKKRMDNGEGVNRHAGSGRKTVVDRDSLRDVNRGTASLTGFHSRDSLRDAIRGTTVFQMLSTHLLTPSSSSMRFLIA